MKTTLISFGTGLYQHRLLLLALSARLLGKADHTIMYTPRKINALGYDREYPWAKNIARGMGYYSWKPFIIHQTLLRMNEGDLLVYSDAGRFAYRYISHPLPSLAHWLDAHDQDILPGVEIPEFGNMEQWTNKNTFRKMEADTGEYWHMPPIQASFSVWRKTETSLQLARKWYKYSKDITIIGDLPPEQRLDNHPGFIEHRHDQSLLSILARKKNLSALNGHQVATIPADNKNLDQWMEQLHIPRAQGTKLQSILLLASAMEKMETIPRRLRKILKLRP